MELLLNLVWCLIVAAAAVRFTVWSVGKPARTRLVIGLATVCILAILFPIISVTDDLHGNPAVFEESRTAPIGLTITLAIVVTVAAIVFRPRVIRIAVSHQPAYRILDGVRTATAVRPPPVFVR